ncbi:MAG TPA: alpha-galactosidase [Acidimicrobiales bacterium]|nr:alpha-galactosidase [Acidimicrobiales bacterium]
MASTAHVTDDPGSPWVSLRHDGVMLVLDTGGPHLPRVVYWGNDLGDLSDDELAALPLAGEQIRGHRPPDSGVPITLLPTRAHGWPGWPGLTGHRRGLASQPLFSLRKVTLQRQGSGDAVDYHGVDASAQLTLDGRLELTRDGVLKHRQTLTSTAPAGGADYDVEELLSLFPVPEDTVEVLDYAGRWANEAQPQRHDLSQGTWLREQRRGRTGPDTPLLLCAGTKDFGFRHGEIWGIHLGWSGDQRYLAQRLNTGTTLIGAGEILAAGEVVLGPGESMTTPWTYAVYSNRGLDGASARLHSMLRRRPRHPSKSRPVLLNTWEAVTFDQSYEKLAELADVAAEVGVERFVIDDGWFGGRRDDSAGLGDWYVAKDVWPDGLGPIVDRVRSLGMQFGLWFEPEMVNLDSDVARAHPDWVMGTPGRMPRSWRNQQVLDISNPEAFTYILERLDSLVGEYGIDFIKWDHNRDLADPVHRGGPKAGRPAVRDQTLATYELMDELLQRHPGLEIESCSSGGSRIDFGVLERTDRVWASDNIDPIDRVHIVMGESTLLPLELIGAHVASERSKTTGRRHDLALRLTVALFGHQGIEWDITETTPEERRAVAEWVALAKSFRPLLFGGELVRVERPSDPGTVLFGVVAGDRSEAVFALVREYASPQSETSPLRLDGLKPSGRYLLKRLELGGKGAQAATDGRSRPDVDDVVVRGSLLMNAGVPAPFLRPEEAALFYLSEQPG